MCYTASPESRCHRVPPYRLHAGTDAMLVQAFVEAMIENAIEMSDFKLVSFEAGVEDDIVAM